MAQQQSFRTTSCGMVCGAVSGDRLGPGRTGVVSVLRGAGVLPVALRALCHRPEGVHHVGVDRRSFGRDRRCAGAGAGRPDGLPQRRRGGQRGGPDPGLRPVGHPLRVRTGFLSRQRSKGIVENLCGYAQRDLAVPLLTQAAIDGVAVDISAANTASAAWCAEVNAAVHSEIQTVPNERLIAERELLQPLPSLRLQIGAGSVLRKVDRLSCVRYGSARYSVPTRLIGATVAVVVDHGAVCLVEPSTGMIVAEHELTAPGSASILDAHYDGPRPTPSRGPRPKTSVEKQFCDLGDDAQAFLVGAAAIGNTRLGSELEILLSLGAAHGTDALLSARHRAVAFGRFRAADVRSILAAGTGTPQPRPAGDALILDLPVAPTRSLDAYKISSSVDDEVIS